MEGQHKIFLSRSTRVKKLPDDDMDLLIAVAFLSNLEVTLTTLEDAVGNNRALAMKLSQRLAAIVGELAPFSMAKLVSRSGCSNQGFRTPGSRCLHSRIVVCSLQSTGDSFVSCHLRTLHADKVIQSALKAEWEDKSLFLSKSKHERRPELVSGIYKLDIWIAQRIKVMTHRPIDLKQYLPKEDSFGETLQTQFLKDGRLGHSNLVVCMAVMGESRIVSGSWDSRDHVRYFQTAERIHSNQGEVIVESSFVTFPDSGFHPTQQYGRSVTNWINF
jgi:hypothetical protein